ncbi:MAG: hypothetical protein HXX17_02680 [Geobacteraceae bacterium]|nr:hypothetical protein [Geobacteraceae bacterium]
MAVKEYASNVFINCPFDKEYFETFRAIVFAVFDCNFRARCALEEVDGGEVRIEKISRIISQCKYGIHDISRTELCKTTNLPRFNMPLELGIFLGARKYGNSDQKKKSCLILDVDRYRYQIFISDIAGQDIKQHDNNPEKAIKVATDWLRNASKRTTVPGGAVVVERYRLFRDKLPEICRIAGIREDELGFNDFAIFASEWIRNNLRG